MKTFPLLLSSLVVLCGVCFAQEAGDTVRLEGSSTQGVPVHPAAGDPTYVRWENGTIGKVLRRDPATRWLEVEANEQKGWIVRRYLAVVDPGGDDPGEDPDAEVVSHVIGTWNLEWCHNSKRRGFPESAKGGPVYGPRTDADFALIAHVITNDLTARLLILSEINGTASKRSKELDRLVGLLGESWEYEIGASGAQQRVAMLYDKKFMRKNFAHEFTVPFQKIDDSDVFARDPLVVGFTLLDKTGNPRNDFVAIGLHLASGQSKVRNHNRAMEILSERLRSAFADGRVPAAERDVILGGDFNASAYDRHLEAFWTNYDSELQFRALIPEEAESYPGSRLAGVPLFPSSKLDYLMASGTENGALKDIVQWTGHVHTELIVNGPDDYRRQISDHLPVTIRIKVQNDDD